MIFFVTALKCEAELLIQKFGLKKNNEINNFDIFLSESKALIISGIGKIKAAVATTFLLTLLKADENDIVINFGICGGIPEKIEIESLFLINKIIDNDSKRVYYPDILLNTEINESEIETFSHIVKNADETLSPLVDMESSGFFESASKFVQKQNIYILKVVSDLLKPEKIDTDFIKNIIQKHEKHIENIVLKAESLSKNNKNIIEKEDINIINSLSDSLNLTLTMKRQLFFYLKKYKIFHPVETDNPITAFLNTTVKNKNERKVIFDEIISELDKEKF